jgi:Acetyltransferase (GNAT) domain
MTSDDVPTLHQLDTAANGYARPLFLTAWLNGDGALRDTRVLIDDDDGTIDGFATWRRCRQANSIKFGPIVAPTADDAMHLIADIIAAIVHPSSSKTNLSEADWNSTDGRCLLLPRECIVAHHRWQIRPCKRLRQWNWGSSKWDGHSRRTVGER